MDEQVAAARRVVEAAGRIVVLTGAGISTDSGIPDFRGPNGVWTKNPEAEKTSNIHYYLNDPDVRKAAWRNRLTSPIWSAQPNPGHLALVELHHQGKLDTVVTQNIDGLHIRAGLPKALVVEIHGNAHSVICWSCGETAPMERALDRVRAGEDDPPCRSCDGVLKSTTVSFGQQLDPDDLVRASEAGQRADLLLAVGSTLTVYPAADLVPLALRRGVPVVIVNGEATEFDPYVEVVVRGSISSVLPEIVRGAQPPSPDAGPV